MNKMHHVVILGCAMLACGVLGLSAAASPSTITYQGSLTDPSGAAVADGNYVMAFGIFDVEAGGSPLWTEGGHTVAVIRGAFSVQLGTTVALGTVFDNLAAARWLEITVTVGGAPQVFVPRVPISAAPSTFKAAKAGDADTVDGQHASAFATVSHTQDWTTITGKPATFTPSAHQHAGADVTSGKIDNARLNTGSGNGLDADKVDGLHANALAYWALTGNDIAAGQFLGTSANDALDIKVNSVRAMRIEPTASTPNLLGGYLSNSATAGVVGAAIAGGGFSAAQNAVTDNYGVVGGGAKNQAGDGDATATDAQYATVAGGHDNAAKGTAATVGGGETNEATGVGAVVAGGQSNKANTGSRPTVGGGYSNQATGNSAVVAGGSTNTASGGYAAVAGGSNNVASGGYAALGGGTANEASGSCAVVGGGSSNVSSSSKATVGGGYDNTASNIYATVAGGYTNQATGIYAFVGGGSSNVASGSRSTIGGGDGNRTPPPYSTIAGGQNNQIVTDVLDTGCTIGGGISNSAGLANGADPVADTCCTVGGGESNEARGKWSTVAGGRLNDSTGETSAVGGGYTNRAAGTQSTVPGGYSNHADGDYSFAAGHNAWVTGDGAFGWADSTPDEVFSVTTDNRFAVRATGGVYLTTGLHPTTGAYLAGGSGTWVSMSDRNAKDNVVPVNPLEVLEKVAAMPVTAWNYKGDERRIPHMGPMAQDMYAAFGLGEDDKGIATVDADGVALAAIQGLNEKFKAQAVENGGLKQRVESQAAEIADLKQQLAAVKAVVQKLVAK